VKTQIEDKLRELDEVLHSTELDAEEKAEVVREIEKFRLELVGESFKLRAKERSEDEDHPVVSVLQGLGQKLASHNPKAAERINAICLGLSRMGI
tara:strand:+ start:36361 stop:36645 length:285 start_codon:yes stop_codon:yes gene_type:complete